MLCAGSVAGSVTEVFVDIKPYGLREESYTIPGEVVVIPLPQPDYGYTVRCHVQATTTNVTIAMKLAGREVPGIYMHWKLDEIPKIMMNQTLISIF